MEITHARLIDNQKLSYMKYEILVYVLGQYTSPWLQPLNRVGTVDL